MTPRKPILSHLDLGARVGEFLVECFAHSTLDFVQGPPPKNQYNCAHFIAQTQFVSLHGRRAPEYKFENIEVHAIVLNQNYNINKTGTT
jgi:hypothetical protein